MTHDQPRDDDTDGDVTAMVDDTSRVCGECGEPAVPEPPTTQPWTDTRANTGQDVPSWSHTDGEPLCPVIGDDGYQPGQPVRQDTDDDTDGM